MRSKNCAYFVQCAVCNLPGSLPALLGRTHLWLHIACLHNLGPVSLKVPGQSKTTQILKKARTAPNQTYMYNVHVAGEDDDRSSQTPSDLADELLRSFETGATLLHTSLEKSIVSCCTVPRLTAPTELCAWPALLPTV